MPTISICLSSLLCLVFQWIESTSISICLSFLLYLVLQWIELTPNSSAFIVSEPPPPPKASSIVHEHWVDCVSPLFLESTACPLPLLGCLYAPTFLRQLCVDYLSLCQRCVNCLSSRRLHDNYTRKPRAPPKSRATCRYPRAACLPSLLVSPTPPPTICVSTTRSC